MPRPADTLTYLFHTPAPPTTLLPLQGVTLLAVEDSRYASDALRLLSQRSGARLRRAESLEAAWAHLRVYRPDVILIDLGLPDGRGESLIRRLASALPPRTALLGMSGDPSGRGAALAAGADAFLEKPVAGLAVFQTAILSLLAERIAIPAIDGVVVADPLALHDDLAQAARAVGAKPGPDVRRYLSGFLTGLARQTRDADLTAAATTLNDPSNSLDGLSRLLNDRLSHTDPFRPGA